MKFLIGFLVTIGLLIVVFILIFRGAAGNHTTTPQTKLVDYAHTSTVMQLTEEGPVQADSTYNSVRITVSDMEVAVEVFKGYNGEQINSKTYTNNSAAYADFLAALQRAGYTLGNTSKDAADERGACATGTRYVMGIKDNGQDKQRFWAANCRSSGQTFRGNVSAVVMLFHKQVPDYENLTANINL